MIRNHACWRSLVAAIALSITTPAFADDSVETLFKDGVAAAEAGQADLAYAKLSAAWKLQQRYDIAGNLGVIENVLGKHRDAAEHLDFALRNFPGSGDSGTRAGLEGKLGELKQKIATLEISAPAGATIELDGKSLGNAPLPGDVFVDPGKHTLLGKQAGMVDAKLDFEVGAGESKTVSIELAPPAAPKVAEERRGRAMWPAYTGFGVAAAGIGVGIAGFVLSAQARSESETLATAIAASTVRCNPEGGQPTIECKDAVSSFVDSQGYQGMGIAGMAVGGAALAFAVVYMVFPDGSDSGDEPKKATAAVSPWFGPDGGGFAVSGRF